MDAPMGGLAREPEPGRVVVEHRQREEQAGDEPGGARPERPEPHLGIELLLEAAGLRDRGEIGMRHGGKPGSGRREPPAARRGRPGAGRVRSGLRQPGFPVEVFGAGMDRDSGALERRLLADDRPLAWPASRAARVLSLHRPLTTAYTTASGTLAEVIHCAPTASVLTAPTFL